VVGVYASCVSSFPPQYSVVRFGLCCNVHEIRLSGFYELIYGIASIQFFSTFSASILFLRISKLRISVVNCVDYLGLGCVTLV
jgi:hypothetical protein